MKQIFSLGVGSEHEVIFTDLLANGQAVGRANGIVVFVDGPLPGERARIRVTTVKANYATGAVVSLLTRSPDRVAPFCKVFGVCGGCQVQHLAYPAQLRWKREMVRSALERIGGLADVVVAQPVGMIHPRQYRNKMSLVVANGTPVRFGFYQARSHAFVDVDSCPVVLPQLDAMIPKLRALAGGPERAFFDGARHAIVRAGQGTGQAVLSLTTVRASRELAEHAPAVGAALRVAGVSNTFEPASANAVMGRKRLNAWGSNDMEEAIDGTRFRVSAASFFQVNSEIVFRIYRFLEPGLTQPLRVVDLYCGAGTFAIRFAQRGSTVVGIEENLAAVKEAVANAELNDVAGRTRFLAGRTDEVLKSKAGRDALADAEVVFLDPPRKGSDEVTLDAIVAARVPNVWYLSCNPATLARDLQRMTAGGYVVKIVQPFDMFPQTGHIETLVALRYADRPPQLELPEVSEEEWGEPPVWPADEKFAHDIVERDYPDFVER